MNEWTCGHLISVVIDRVYRHNNGVDFMGFPGAMLQLCINSREHTCVRVLSPFFFFLLLFNVASMHGSIIYPNAWCSKPNIPFSNALARSMNFYLIKPLQICIILPSFFGMYLY
jgi:hypothetical protein